MEEVARKHSPQVNSEPKILPLHVEQYKSLQFRSHFQELLLMPLKTAQAITLSLWRNADLSLIQTFI